MESKLFNEIFLKDKRKQVSFTKTTEHKEGDVWKEKGKTWTIQNGIKITISVLDNIRKETHIPHLCPQCNRPMNKKLDVKFYTLFKMCMDCKIEEDTELIKKGKFDEYAKEYTKKNKLNWFEDLKAQLADFIDNHDNQYLYNEFGEKEEWSKEMSKEELKKIFDKQIIEIEKQINKS